MNFVIITNCLTKLNITNSFIKMYGTVEVFTYYLNLTYPKLIPFYILLIYSSANIRKTKTYFSMKFCLQKHVKNLVSL